MPRIGQQLTEVYRQAVADCDARALVTTQGPVLRAHAAGRAPLLLAAGKAAVPMARAVVEQLGAVAPGSLACAPSPGDGSTPGVTCLPTDHPLPGPRSLHAARQVRRAVHALPTDTPVVVALSGGASAGWLEPASELDLDDVVQTQRLLMAAGADIAQLNTVRRHLATLLGGRLGLAVHPRPLLCLALVDVVNGTAHDVGSGPTVGDPTRYQDAVQVLARLELLQRVPEAVRRHLGRGARGELDENPAPADPRLARGSWLAVGTPALLRERAAQRARAAGLCVEIEPRLVDGRVPAVAAELAGWARQAEPGTVRVLAGEPTLTLPAELGHGGRARHLALTTALWLRELGRPWCVLVAGSDGIDGTGPAAGAVLDAEVLRRADAERIAQALARADSGTLLASLGAELTTGPSGTNLCDLILLWVGDEERA